LLKSTPSAIGQDTIEDLRDGLRDEGARESTIDRHIALVRAILRKARDELRYIDYAAKPCWPPNCIGGLACPID
jgi:hypothetical protein